MALTPKRIYGPNQTAGVLMTTTGKGQINNDGNDAYAQAVVLVDAAGAVIPSGYSSANYTTTNTFLTKTGAGVLHSITINTAGVTSSVVLYDGLSAAGTKIATVSTLAQNTVVFDAAFAVGLTVVNQGGTPADITVLYR